MKLFLAQNSESTAKIVLIIERRLIAAEDPVVFTRYFCKLFEKMRENNVKPENIYNMYEKRFMIGCGKQLHVIFQKGRRNDLLVTFG